MMYRRLRFFRGENIFIYKRKVENYFYEILLLNEILVNMFQNIKIFHLKIYYMKISYMKKPIYSNSFCYKPRYVYVRRYTSVS